MRMCLAICLGLLSSGPALASDCIQPNNQCTPLVGCILSQDTELLLGEVKGVSRGTIFARTSKGAACQGTFRKTGLGIVRGTFTCDDGRNGRATFAYFHERTGTGRGKGRMNNGDRLVFWAGDRLLDYFAKQPKEPQDLIACARKALKDDPYL